jgi:hypothetical protein
MIATMRASCLAVALALAAFASPVRGQTMEFGCPDPGTTISFDSGTRLVSRGQEGMDCKMESADGKSFKVRGLLISNVSPDGGDNSAFIAALKPERLWPLKVGNKIEASYSAGGKSWTYILSVARQEKKAGPGGALVDTFLVEMNEQGDGGFRSLSRWWISPAEKYFIQFDASNSNGTSNRAIVTAIKH